MWVNTSKGTNVEQLPHFNFVIYRITTLSAFLLLSSCFATSMKMYMSDSALDVTDLKKGKKMKEKKVLPLYFISAEN